MKTNLVWILIWSLVIPFSPARAATGSSAKALGLFWVGEKGNWEGMPGFELQKELQRWAENHPALKLEIGEEPKVVTAASLDAESARWRLLKISAELLTASLSAKEAWDSFLGESPESKILAPIKKLHAEIPKAEIGEAGQRSLVAQAAYAWRLGRESEMAELLRQATVLHPEGKLTFSAENLESGLADVFQMKLESAKERVPRQCQVNFSAMPSGARLVGGGFELEATNAIAVTLGRHAFRVLASNGDRGPVQTVECQRAGVQNVQLPAPQPSSGAKNLKDSLRNSSAALLIRPGEKEGQVLLYSPEGIDELGKIDLADTGPRASGAWKKELYRNLNTVAAKHRLVAGEEIALADLMVASPQSSDESYDALEASSTTAATAASDRWYNNWKFWAIAGTLLAGGAAVYFISRPSSVGERGSVTVEKR